MLATSTGAGGPEGQWCCGCCAAQLEGLQVCWLMEEGRMEEVHRKKQRDGECLQPIPVVRVSVIYLRWQPFVVTRQPDTRHTGLL